MSILDPTLLFEGVRVIPVLTIERTATAVPLARALVSGGLKVLEVTLRTAVALDAVRAIAREVPRAVVGVGTVTAPADGTGGTVQATIGTLTPGQSAVVNFGVRINP